MYNLMAIFGLGVSFFLSSVLMSVIVLIRFQKKTSIDTSEQLRCFVRVFSVIPFILHACMWGSYLIGIIADPNIFHTMTFFEGVAAFLGIFVYGGGSILSAVFGSAIDMLGLYFSIRYTKESGKNGIKYIVFSSLCMCSSLFFFIKYLFSMLSDILIIYGK